MIFTKEQGKLKYNSLKDLQTAWHHIEKPTADCYIVAFQLLYILFIAFKCKNSHNDITN